VNYYVFLVYSVCDTEVKTVSLELCYNLYTEHPGSSGACGGIRRATVARPQPGLNCIVCRRQRST
jgi:hypothetical protein